MKVNQFCMYCLMMMMIIVESYRESSSSSSSRRRRSFALCNNKISNELGGNLLSKSLFAATELFGQITKSNSNKIDNGNTSNKRMSVEKVGDAIKREYEQIFWATVGQLAHHHYHHYHH